jgi:hypothetical protein
VYNIMVLLKHITLILVKVDPKSVQIL